MTRILSIPVLFILVGASAAVAQLPSPPFEMVSWSNSFSPLAPGVFSADDLISKPAGSNGPVIVKGGHFFTGDKRIRFWGVNICFSGAFPTHEQADATARRLAHFGINCVRFHHMD